MGASSTFGWGVAKENTYPVLLEKILKKNKKSSDVQVLNAGQIGFTTFQGKIFLEKYILDYFPDVITVSYILNDIDRCRFLRNEKKHDNELAVSALWKVTLKNIISRSRIYFIGKRALAGITLKNEKFLAHILRGQYENAQIRVSAEEYRDNLIKIAAICKANNIELIFLKMPVHLMLPKLTEKEKALMLNGIPPSKYFYKRACSFQAREDYKKAAIKGFQYT